MLYDEDTKLNSKDFHARLEEAVAETIAYQKNIIEKLEKVIEIEKKFISFFPKDFDFDKSKIVFEYLDRNRNIKEKLSEIFWWTGNAAKDLWFDITNDSERHLGGALWKFVEWDLENVLDKACIEYLDQTLREHALKGNEVEEMWDEKTKEMKYQIANKEKTKKERTQETEKVFEKEKEHKSRGRR